MSKRSGSSSFDEDIAERRVSDALATTLLLVSALCLLGAIVIQVYECSLYRVPGTDTLLADATGKRAAVTYAGNLKADLVRTCVQIEAAYKKGDEQKPTKGHIEGTNFIPDEPMDLSEDMKTAAEQLCARYGYGYKILASVLDSRGIGAQRKPVEKEEPVSAPEEEEPAEKAVEEKPAAEPAEEPAMEPAEEEPAEEPAMEPAEEEPAEEPAVEPAAEEPAEEPAVEPAAEEPAEEPAVEPAAEEPAEEPAVEPAEEPGDADEEASIEAETEE
ncbi:MAG TPA: hypothetical protein PLU74_10955 [Planctomycetota bacterium]|jgi:hypothetical protein|nr:hypothetical protein [Planctomycetota bacterium]OQC22184.1 MAG: hypothetical protein BWX69_00035 [Planctomycetes bacterium ADurb.Bin069]HNR99748.1 hypothetical protein [Planctomycetota bacterium]HNU25367.1 hypothetical protein [Planctomycetota bacterium]HOE29364.1 hypothetical protein [Planctomycetota bacterium]